MMVGDLRVIKVGGSLLQIPDLVDRMQRRLNSSESRQNVFVMGGGNFCNELRVLHQRFGLSEATSHDLCLHQMSVTSRLLANLMQLEVSEDLEQIRTAEHDLVFDCRRWMLKQISAPKSWDVTSDSIVALLAAELQCELVMLKSVDTHDVDDYFEVAAKDVPQVSFVNLRTT